MYEKYMLVKGKHFEINRITNFHSTSSELYFEKSSNMTKTIWQKWVITFFYEIHSAHLIYPRVKWTCAGKYVERVKSHSWALGAGLNCRAGKLEGRVNTPRIRYVTLLKLWSQSKYFLDDRSPSKHKQSFYFILLIVDALKVC